MSRAALCSVCHAALFRVRYFGVRSTYVGVHSVPATLWEQHSEMTRRGMECTHAPVLPCPCSRPDPSYLAHGAVASSPCSSRCLRLTHARPVSVSFLVQVDCGAMCMPGAAEKVQELIDDAVAKGAKVREGSRHCCSGGE